MAYTLTNQVEWLPNHGWDSRIHIAANGDLVYVFVLVTQRYIILVDTLLNPTTAQALVDYVRPYLPGRQLLIINSHSDWDHAWGNQLFAGPTARYPAPIIAHVQSASMFDHPETIAFLRETQAEHPEIFNEVLLTKPTLTFSNDLWIDGGDLTLHLFPTPGHMPDHISIFIPEVSTLLVGDAAEFPFPAAENATTLPELRASLAKLVQVRADTLLYCHAPPTMGPLLLQDNIAYFDTLEAACRDALARGLNPAQIPDGELAVALNCDFSSIARVTGPWTNLLPDDLSEQHIEQLRLMLAWLQQESTIEEN